MPSYTVLPKNPACPSQIVEADGYEWRAERVVFWGKGIAMTMDEAGLCVAGEALEGAVGLSASSKAMLELRFGLTDGRRRTLAEVGRAFGLGRENYKKVEVAALQVLRQPTVAEFAVDWVAGVQVAEAAIRVLSPYVPCTI